MDPWKNNCASSSDSYVTDVEEDAYSWIENCQKSPLTPRQIEFPPLVHPSVRRRLSECVEENEEENKHHNSDITKHSTGTPGNDASKNIQPSNGKSPLKTEVGKSRFSVTNASELPELRPESINLLPFTAAQNSQTIHFPCSQFYPDHIPFPNAHLGKRFFGTSLGEIRPTTSGITSVTGISVSPDDNPGSSTSYTSKSTMPFELEDVRVKRLDTELSPKKLSADESTVTFKKLETLPAAFLKAPTKPVKKSTKCDWLFFGVRSLSDKKNFVIAAVGIFVCYLYYGIIQEKITRGRYGGELQEDGTRGERFTYALALVGVQCICNWIFAKAMLIVKPQNQDTTPKVYYASSALAYLLGMVSSNMALRWVAYPMQVIAKSAKPIPVMLLGVLIGRKSYTLWKYMFVLVIVVGVVLFMFKEGNTSNSPLDQEGLGQLLLLMSLMMDGVLGAIQERTRQHSSPSAQQMMLAMNGWSTLFLIPALLVTGEAMEFIAFATKYTEVLGHLAKLALAGALGQLFIFMMVSSYGPLACSVITTTRKFFTILCSVVLSGNNLTGRQWIGTVLVFIGLFTDMFYGKKGVAAGKSPQT